MSHIHQNKARAKCVRANHSKTAQAQRQAHSLLYQKQQYYLGKPLETIRPPKDWKPLNMMQLRLRRIQNDMFMSERADAVNEAVGKALDAAQAAGVDIKKAMDWNGSLAWLHYYVDPFRPAEQAYIRG